jgi:hypothetical protein
MLRGKVLPGAPDRSRPLPICRCQPFSASATRLTPVYFQPDAADRPECVAQGGDESRKKPGATCIRTPSQDRPCSFQEAAYRNDGRPHPAASFRRWIGATMTRDTCCLSCRLARKSRALKVLLGTPSSAQASRVDNSSKWIMRKAPRSKGFVLRPGYPWSTACRICPISMALLAGISWSDIANCSVATPVSCWNIDQSLLSMSFFSSAV